MDKNLQTNHELAPIENLILKGQISFERCDFSLARQYLTQALKNPSIDTDLKLKATYYIFRCDMEDGKSIAFEDLIEELEKVESDFALYFIAALHVLSKSPQKGRKIALDLFRQSKSSELKQKSALLYADCLAQTGKYARSLKIIDQIPDDFTDLYFCKEITKGRLLSILGRKSEAEKQFLSTFHQLFGSDYWYYVIRCMLYYANFLRISGSKDQALTLLKLLPQSKVNSMKSVKSFYEIEIKNLLEPVDIIYDSGLRIVHLKDKYDISLGNQNILIKLLLLFIKNKGVKFSKEELIQKVWEEKYDPIVHDNKIYYSINRLRNLLGQSKVNKFIVSHGLSYALNENIKVEIK